MSARRVEYSTPSSCRNGEEEASKISLGGKCFTYSTKSPMAERPRKRIRRARAHRSWRIVLWPRSESFSGGRLDAGLIDTTPVSNIPRPAAENRRDRVLSDDEIVLFWKGCETLGWPFGSLFRLLLLTAQRRDEVGSMTWLEVDLEGGLWTLPR
jgi:integrase